MKPISLKNCCIAVISFCLAFTLSCGNDDGLGFNPGNVSYSGTGSFSFTGDTTMNFMGTVDNAGIIINNGNQLLPFNLKNGDLTLLVGVNGDPEIKARSYAISGSGGEGWVTISLLDEFYDAKSGVITITTLNSNQIKGSIDVALRALFSFNDNLFIKGDFELNAM